MGKRDKQAVARSQPDGKSVRVGADPGDANLLSPIWSIATFDLEGPWGRRGLKEAHLWDHIFPKLRDYESMSWNEIYRNKQRDHSVEVEGIIKRARDRLVVLRLDDLDELFRFRLTGKMRVWGIRDGRVFKILWWDPEHEIWPSEKN
jgi:hypothetical protein